jgi:hypothetical protein
MGRQQVSFYLGIAYACHLVGQLELVPVGPIGTKTASRIPEPSYASPVREIACLLF